MMLPLIIISEIEMAGNQNDQFVVKKKTTTAELQRICRPGSPSGMSLDRPHQGCAGSGGVAAAVWRRQRGGGGVAAVA